MRAQTKIGDRVAYAAFDDEKRIGTVTASFDDIKNGKPGFDLVTDMGETFWGYDHQILAINSRA